MARTKKVNAASLIRECMEDVRRGLGDKRPTKEARQYWLRIYSRSFRAALANGSDWEISRKRVRRIAEKLGRVAASLSSGNLVLVWAAESAAIAVKADPGCPGSVGAGGFCP